MSPGSICRIISDADTACFKLINSGMGCEWLDPVMLLVTALGTGIVQTGMSLSLIISGLLLDKVNLRRAGYAGLIAFVMAGSLVQLGKLVWNRPRPLLSTFDVRMVGDPLFAQSFPSGHTMTAFAVMCACSALLPKARYVLIPLAFLTGVSRVYLGVHFPLDVIYGGLLGALVGTVAARRVMPRDRAPGPDIKLHEGETPPLRSSSLIHDR